MSKDKGIPFPAVGHYVPGDHEEQLGWFVDSQGDKEQVYHSDIVRTALTGSSVYGSGTEEDPWHYLRDRDVHQYGVSGRARAVRTMGDGTFSTDQIDLDNDPIVDPNLDLVPDLTPEEEEEQMPAEASVEHQYKPAEASVELDSEDSPDEGFAEDKPDETANILSTPPVAGRILVVGSASWEIPQTVWLAISNWQQRHGVTDLTVATTGCPTGAEAAVRQHPGAHMIHHEVIRDEDIARAGFNAALFFIRDESEGASRLLDEALAGRVPVTVYREESTVDISPWRNH